MIPKIVHYCWFGKGLMPKSQRDCIKGWKKLMPDYQFMRWDESNFDVQKLEYTKAAYAAKKYAYVSDVARCEALLKFGGLYIDTDVEVFQRFDEYLINNKFFTAIEIYSKFDKVKSQYVDENGKPLQGVDDVPWCGILSSTIGCEPGNVLIQDCLDFYRNWNPEKGSFVTIDGLIAKLAVPYGFVYKDVEQHLQHDMTVYPTGLFGFYESPNTQYSVSYHHNAASWVPKSKNQKKYIFFDKIGLLGLYKKYKGFKRRVKKCLKNK